MKNKYNEKCFSIFYIFNNLVKLFINLLNYLSIKDNLIAHKVDNLVEYI